MKIRILFCFLSISVFAQTPKKELKKVANFPVIFVDSVNVDKDEFLNLDQKQVGSVSVYKDEKAKELAGEQGKDGVVYVETIKFSKIRYWNYFKSKSAAYLKIVPTPEADTNIKYILNEKILDVNFEGMLATTINDKVYKKIVILSKDELAKRFNITNKDFGVQIIADVPEESNPEQK